MAFFTRCLPGALVTALAIIGAAGDASALPPLATGSHADRSPIIQVEHRERYAPPVDDEDGDGWFEADRPSWSDDDEDWEPYGRRGRMYVPPGYEEDRYERRYGRYDRRPERYRDALDRQKEAIKAQRKAQKEYLKAQARAWRQQYRY